MVAIKCNEKGAMPKHDEYLYLMCVYGSLRCAQNDLQCKRHKSKNLADVKQAFFFPLSFFCVVSCVCCIIRLAKVMAPLQVPKKLKLELFFGFKANVMLISLSNVGSNVHIASNSSQNPISSDHPKSMRDGKELNYFEPLEKETQKSKENSHVF